MRKFTALALSTILALSLAGCGSSGKAAATTAAGTKSAAATTGSAAAGAASSAAATKAAGSSAAKAGGDVVHLKFMNWGMAEESTTPAFKAMIDAFNSSHPNIQVEGASEAYNSYLDQVLIMNASGEMPDCLQIQNSMVSAMVGAGALADITGMIDDKSKADFYPNLMQAMTYDGKQYGLPWTASSVVLYCNMDLLKQAGYDAPPTSMQQLREMAAKISALGSDKKGNTIYGFGMQTKALDTTGYYFLPYLWNFGADLCDDSGKVTINSPEGIKALDFAKGLAADKVIPVGQEIKDLRNMFANNQLGFIIDSAFGYAAIQKMAEDKDSFIAKTQLAAVPSDSGKPINFFIAHDLGVSAKSQHKKEAYTFIEWLSSADAIKIYNEKSANIMPCRKSVEGLDYYTKAGNEYMKVYIDQLPKARQLPEKYSGFKSSMLDIANALQRVIINQEDSATVMNDLSKQLETDYVK